MTSDLTCPVCGGQLVPWAVGDVTVHGCQACGGVWFERGGIEAAASLPGEALRAIEHEFSAGLGTREGDGCCPRDGAPLRTVRWYQAPQVSVRACCTCRGFWCDEGVLGDLESALPPSRPRRELPWLEAEAPPRRIETSFCRHCGWPVVAEALVCDRCGELPAGDPERTAALSSHTVDPVQAPLELAALLLVLIALWLVAPDWGSTWLLVGGLWLIAYGMLWLVRPTRVETDLAGLSYVGVVHCWHVEWDSVGEGRLYAWWPPVIVLALIDANLLLCGLRLLLVLDLSVGTFGGLVAACLFGTFSAGIVLWVPWVLRNLPGIGEDAHLLLLRLANGRWCSLRTNVGFADELFQVVAERCGKSLRLLPMGATGRASVGRSRRRSRPGVTRRRPQRLA